MAERGPLSLWRRFLALPNDSRAKTLGVAFLVALVSAGAVSVTATMLKPRQLANVAAQREARLAEMVATLPGLADLLRDTGAERLDSVIIDLTQGRADPAVDAANFDYLAVQNDPAQTTALTPEQDIAGIARRPDRAPVYLLRGADRQLALVVLPIYGAGYQSTIRAYLALSADLMSIAALSIYEQGDTPGLGARITDPAWQASWSGRQALDPAGQVVITLVRSGASAPHEVDGISGATRSSTGVARMVQFWLGQDGFGPYLDALRAGGGS